MTQIQKQEHYSIATNIKMEITKKQVNLISAKKAPPSLLTADPFPNFITQFLSIILLVLAVVLVVSVVVINVKNNYCLM